MTPRLIGIKGGWAAIGIDWAVFGDTKEEVLKKFTEAARIHDEIMTRPLSAEEVDQEARV